MTKIRPIFAILSTRDNLIDVGVELMQKHGYWSVGVQEILKTAGVPRGSFYHHFRSKEEFASAVVERYVSLEETRWQEVLNNAGEPPLKRLRNYFENLNRANGMSAPIRGCLIGSLSLEVAGTNPLLQRCLSSGFARWQNAISTVLREAVERAELPQSTNIDSLSGFVLNSWQGALLRTQADRSDAPLQGFLHYLFDGYLNPQRI